MEKVGVQVSLSIRQACQIALQGIRIRLGRALVTISGVTLGIAFLMSSVTSQLVIQAVAKEREIKRKVELMETTLKNEIGALENKAIAVVICGELSKIEEQFLKKLAQRVSETNLIVAGSAMYAQQSSIDKISQPFSCIIMLGNAENASSTYNVFAEKLMPAATLLDSLNNRNYAKTAFENIKKEMFFAQLTEEEKNKALQKEKENKFRIVWIGVISILVTIISVSNALLMSVTERFKEIGTMKCLGALSSFIRQLFLIESAVIGITGSVIGALLGAIFSVLVFSFSFSFGTIVFSLNYMLLVAYGIGAIVIGTLLSILAAIYPANVAAKMIPATALRTNV